MKGINKMTKEQEFLQFVQTIILTNGINLSLNKDAIEKRHILSATGVMGTLFDAVEASKKIPSTMSSIEAANEFCGYMLQNLREEDANVPPWFAKH